jgi:hypothetical protein
VTTFERRGLPFAVIEEAVFIQLLRLERRRTERSGKQFMLVLVSGEDFLAESGGKLINDVVAAISSSTRETDVIGWYERQVTLGLLMTEISQADSVTINTIIQKISLSVQNAVDPGRYCRLTLMFRVFPQETANLSYDEPDSILYPDPARRHDQKRHGRALKRAWIS